MPRIGPRNEQEQGGNRAELVPPGRYVLSLASFTRKVSKAGGEYLNAKWEVHSGAAGGKTFWSGLMMDFTKNGTVVRWQMLFEAMGIEETIEVGSYAEGTQREGDRNIAKWMRGRAFVAEVDKTKDGQYENNGIARIIPERNWTDAERDIVEAQDEAREQRAEPEDYAGDPPSGGVSDPDPQDFGPDDYGDPAEARSVSPADDADPF